MHSEALVSFLVELLAKSALILLAAALLQRAWTRASAAQRHLVWCAALGTILLLPLTRSVAPRWSVPLVRITTTLPTRDALPQVPPVQTRAESIMPAAAPSRQWHGPDWRTIVGVGWAVGTIGLLALRLLGSVRLRWLRASSELLKDERAGALAAKIVREIGIRRRVELRLAPTGCVPLTWGTLRPVLMLPAEALGWSDAYLTAALRHEVGHIARGDHFTRWIASLACAFYWPNPLVWLAARALRTAQEQATDDLVLRTGTAPGEYAAQLFEVARTLAARHGLAHGAVAMASPSTLERRMLAIVDAQRDRRPLTLRAVVGGMLAVALTLGLATAAQVQAQKEPTATVSSAGAEQAPPAASVADLKGPLVEITAKFIEFSDGNTALPDFLKASDPKSTPGVRAMLTDPQLQEIVRTLNATKGMDLLSAPRVTTKSGQKAVVEIIREFRYPTEFAKDDKTGEWAPKTFDTKNVGVTFEVTAVVSAEGTIELQMLPEVTEFEGYFDFDAAPAKSGAAPDALTPSPGREFTRPDAKTFPKGHRTQPIFSTRKMDATVTMHNGGTVVLGSLNREDVQTVEDSVPVLGDIPFAGRLFRSTTERHIHRRLFIFVTATLVNEPPPAITGSAAPDPLTRVILPVVELRETKLSEAVQILLEKGRAAGAGPVNIVVAKLPPSEPVLTLALRDISFPDAVLNVATMAGFSVRREANAYVLEPRTGSAPALPANDADAPVPVAQRVPGKPDFVTSPHAPGAGYIDVTGFAPGTKVRCPYTGKIFSVPER